MIRKELDDLTITDKYAAAGRKAEERMAFYLKRFFGTAEDINVLNGVRLAREDDAAQVDHLIVHTYGLVIVESKSVAQRVQIRDDGQWVRWYGSESRGMASPITQAKLQAQFFRYELIQSSRNKELFKQLPIDLVIAISDEGAILWPKSGPIAEVCKADQVADRIRSRIESLEAAKAPPFFGGANLETITKFLLSKHSALPQKPAQPAVAQDLPPYQTQPKVPEAAQAHQWGHSSPSSSSSATSARTCSKCGSTRLEIRYGYSYYFHCLDCENNTQVHESCPICGDPAKVRKHRKQFFLDCAKCARSSLFFVNTISTTA